MHTRTHKRCEHVWWSLSLPGRPFQTDSAGFFVFCCIEIYMSGVQFILFVDNSESWRVGSGLCPAVSVQARVPQIPAPLHAVRYGQNGRQSHPLLELHRHAQSCSLSRQEEMLRCHGWKQMLRHCSVMIALILWDCSVSCRSALIFIPLTCWKCHHVFLFFKWCLIVS